MNIRTLQEADIPAAAAIVGKNYSPKDGESATREFQDMFGSAAIKPRYVVAEKEGNIIGVAGFTQSWMDYNVYNIFWVNVDPNHQRKGVGKLLMQRIIDEIKAQPDSRLILLTTDSPAYYQEHFQFEDLYTFMDGTYRLMCLSLEKKIQEG